MYHRWLIRVATAVMMTLGGVVVAAAPAHAATCSYHIAAHTYEGTSGWGSWLFMQTSKNSGPSSCGARIYTSYNVRNYANNRYNYSNDGEVYYPRWFIDGFEQAGSSGGNATLNVRSLPGYTNNLWRNTSRYYILSGSTVLGWCDLPRTVSDATCVK